MKQLTKEVLRSKALIAEYVVMVVAPLVCFILAYNYWSLGYLATGLGIVIFEIGLVRSWNDKTKTDRFGRPIKEQD